MLSSVRLQSMRSATAFRVAGSPAIRNYTTAKKSDEKKPSQNIEEKFIEKHINYQVATYSRPSTVMKSGLGSYMWDIRGNQYIDFMAGIAVTGLGHSNPTVSRILHDQASTLIHSSNLYHNEWTPRLCKSLVETTIEAGGMPSAHAAFISNSGTEANEAALKFARKWGKVQGGGNDSKKVGLVSFTGAFHGRSFGALSVTPNPKYQAPYGPMVPEVKTGTFNDVAGLKTLIDKNTAGVIVEPIQGEGGVNPATPEFLVALRKRCTEVGAALIFDEIQCGLSRTGTLWAHQNYPAEVQPDILTVAKALGNGFPIGATIVNETISNAIQIGDHGTTYGGNPLGARVALEVLRELSSKPLLQGVSKRGKILESKLDSFIEKYPLLVKERRGTGLIQGLELTIPAHHVTSRCHDQGLLLINAGQNVLRFIPALNIPIRVLQNGLSTLNSILRSIHKDLEDGKKAE